MSLSHISHLHGLPVHVFPQPGAGEVPLPEAGAVAWKLVSGLRTDEEDFDEHWERFLDTVDPAGVRALVLGGGAYGGDLDGCDPEETAELLAAAADRLTGLQALYLADLTFEEAELSWIVQGDVSPILQAFPRLRELAVRGSTNGYGSGPGLEFKPVSHAELRVLRFENGGLPAQVLHGLTASELPALEHLDIWLGEEGYGRTATVEDLAPVLDGSGLPALRRLGLQNADIQDEVAAAVASAPVVARLTALHLGRGILTDAGAEALLGGQPLTHLEELDLYHHYLSDEMAERVRQALEPHGVTVDVSGRPELEEDEERYVAAAE